MNQNQFQNIMNQINLSQQDKEKILDNCRNRKHVNNKLFVYSGQIAAALGIALLSATSLTAYAAVSAYQAYMEQMSTEEIQTRYDNLHEGTRQGDRFSRTLSAKERERLNRLRDAYQQGLRFPEESMYCFDGNTAGKPSDAAISYDYINMIFYLPEGELTDEELLQVIDVWEKGNYSLSVMNGNARTDGGKSDADLSHEELIAAAKAEMEKHTQAVSQTDEEMLRQAAAATVSAISGQDLSHMTWSITLYGDINPEYRITIEDETRKYYLFYPKESTLENLTVYSYRAVNKATDAEQEDTTLGYTEAQIQEMLPLLAEDARTALSQAFGIYARVTKCEYGYSKELLTGKTSGMMIALTTETGDRYRFTYSLKDSLLREMLTYEAGKYDDIDFVSVHDVYGSIE